jgi:hypothetical protein
MGFCGADDSVNAEHLQLLSIHYPWIEWGFLFRPDLEGTPRYATMAWVNHLCKINQDTGGTMRLAGHLCGSRCQEVLDGNFSFVAELATKGFGRVQVNATKANNVTVNQHDLAKVASNLKMCIESVPEVEWIFQLNDETSGIWDQLCALCTTSSSKSLKAPTLALKMPDSSTSSMPVNLSCLFDASCGLGKVAAEYASPFTVGTQDIPCGYAGGIGPDNILQVLGNVTNASAGKAVWIDMESSLRVKIVDGVNPAGVGGGGGVGAVRDCFSVEKCMACVLAGASKFPQALPVSRVSLLSV